MLSALHVLVAAGCLLILSTSASDVAPQTTALSYAGQKRAGSVPTVTLGPSSTYITDVGVGQPTPSNDGFIIVPAGPKAEDGINFVMGSDLRTKMESALKDKCSDKKSNSCHDAILDVIPIQQVADRRRSVALLANIGVAVRYIIAGIVALVGALAASKGHHIPYSNIAQASATSASAYAIVPSASASPTTFTVQPSDTPDPTPSIGPGEGKGFSINAPQDLAQKTDDLAGQNSHGCPGPANKRDMTSIWLDKRIEPLNQEVVVCMAALTITIIRNVVQGPIADWIRVNRNNRNMAPAGAGAAVVLNHVQNEVAPLQQQVGVPDDQWRAVVQLAYWEAHNRLVAQQHDNGVVKVSEDDINRQYCPPKDFVKCADSTCRGVHGVCADNTPLKGCQCGDGNDSSASCDPKVTPACPNCGGDAGGQQCKGTGDKAVMKGCRCWVPPKKRPRGRFKNANDFKAAQKAIMGLKDLPDNPGPPSDGTTLPGAHCELRKRQSTDNVVNIETGFFTNLADTACKQKPGDLSTSWDKKLTNKDADEQYKNSFDGYTIEFRWDHKADGNCDPQTCNKVFESFIHSSSQCSPDSHSMAKSGTIDMDCGKATFAITTSSPSTTTSTQPSSTPKPTNCPDAFPNLDDQEGSRAWWDNNHCDKRCPNGQFTCTPGFNDVLRLCSCNNSACGNAGLGQCADQSKSNPFTGENVDPITGTSNPP